MLRIITSACSNQAKKYYSEGLTREGYYAEGQEMAGRWGGIGAKKLGLVGSVQKEAFVKLCDNINPQTNEPLTPRLKSNRRVGYDINFHVPKSITLAYMWHNDERILQAFRQSVDETMDEMEQAVATRVRKGGKDENRVTGNLISASFIHFTARPVDGYPDPHMHEHRFVFNATYDPEEKIWKAAQFGNIKMDAEYYQAVFLSRLAAKLKYLGYEVEPCGKSFELSGISRSLIEKFSRRSKLVEAKANELGIVDPEARHALAATTREKKIKELSLSDLKPKWWSLLSEDDRRELNQLARNRKQLPSSKVAKSLVAGSAVTRFDLEAVDFAIKHIFHRASLVTEKELITEALNWGHGRATVAGVKEALKEFPLRHVERGQHKMITTDEVLMEENRIVEMCRRGIGTMAPINPKWRIADNRLNRQQKAAVLHALSSRDRITGIIGKAGVGKTTVMREIAAGIEASGLSVFAFAPTGRAARGTLRESGFPDADTVDKLLASESLLAEASGAVWLIDEAGLVSSRMDDRLLRLADSVGSRVIFVGDPGQHHSVQRGDALRLMKEFGGMKTVTIDIIQRQKGLYKKAVGLIEQRKHDEAFEILENMGAIREIPSDEERYSAIAQDYLDAFRARESVQLLSPSNDECRLVTKKVRMMLKENGRIGDGKKWNILKDLSWSPAQKSDSRCYRPGFVVKITGHVKGFPMGVEMEVTDVKESGVKIRSKNGREKSLPLSEHENFTVFEKDAIEVCEGDCLRMTVNTRTKDGHRLENGDNHMVKRISQSGSIILENGWKLERDFKYFDYGYTDTSYRAQSKTVDRVLIAQSGLICRGASDAKQFYTSVSRGSKLVHIYTENLDGLRENVSVVRKRELASEAFEQTERVQRMAVGMSM